MSYHRISPAQHRALGNLAHNTPDGTCLLNKSELMRLGIAQHTCEALRTRGLVETIPGSRPSRVQLTDTGDNVLAKADAAMTDAAQRAIQQERHALDSEECEHLLTAMTPPVRDDYWHHAPHPVRLRLHAKGMVRQRPGIHTVWEVTEVGRHAVELVGRASMGLAPEAPTEPMDDGEMTTLHGVIDLAGGVVNPFEDTYTVTRLRERGYLRAVGKYGEHRVTAAGYIAAMNRSNLPRLVSVAAKDYEALLELRQDDEQERRALYAWQDALFTTMSCPPGVDQEIYMELVHQLVDLQAARKQEEERHNGVLRLNDRAQAEVGYRAEQLGVACAATPPGTGA